MTDIPQQDDPRNGGSGSRRSGQPLWFWAVLVAMSSAFGLVVVERDVIRAYWWAHKLATCEEISKQAYYINALLNVGDAADGAVHGMMSHDRVDVRAAAVLILGQSKSPTQIADLVRMLGDADREVCESAARTLAFLDRPDATKALIEGLTTDNIDAATAAAVGLSRVDSPEAICALCRAIGKHERAIVRAQAVESLAAALMSAAGPTSDASESDPECDPCFILALALNDRRGTFSGRLALEREIDAAGGVAVSGNAVLPDVRAPLPGVVQAPRCVSDIARESISMLLGQPLIAPTPLLFQEMTDIADALRQRIADRSVRFDLPTSLPAAMPIQP